MLSLFASPVKADLLLGIPAPLVCHGPGTNQFSHLLSIFLLINPSVFTQMQQGESDPPWSHQSLHVHCDGSCRALSISLCVSGHFSSHG